MAQTEEKGKTEARKITISAIKADVGGYPGHVSVHPHLITEAERLLAEEKKAGLLVDYCVSSCGDDLELIMTHHLGVDSSTIHKLAWDVFLSCTGVAEGLKLYGAGQDLLADSFAGNVRGMGPGVAEMEFEERKSEPIIILMADKTAPSAWNLPLYKIFADPFNSAGLVIDHSMHDGFIFEIHDVKEHQKIEFSCPEELYTLLAFIGSTGKYLVKSVRSKNGTEAASSSTQKLSLIAGKYVGKDDPVAIIRCQSGLPAVGEVLEAFSTPWLVPGWMRGSHNGPLMPVARKHANPSRFDGPPRVVALGFQLAHGKLVGPVDLFDDPSFDHVREEANLVGAFLRRHGPFEPHRLPPNEMEYTTMPTIMRKMKDRFSKID
jgi:fructose 1,6-bisphosphate aldolase/phosphatase